METVSSPWSLIPPPFCPALDSEMGWGGRLLVTREPREETFMLTPVLPPYPESFGLDSWNPGQPHLSGVRFPPESVPPFEAALLRLRKRMLEGEGRRHLSLVKAEP